MACFVDCLFLSVHCFVVFIVCVDVVWGCLCYLCVLFLVFGCLSCLFVLLSRNMACIAWSPINFLGFVRLVVGLFCVLLMLFVLVSLCLRLCVCVFVNVLVSSLCFFLLFCVWVVVCLLLCYLGYLLVSDVCVLLYIPTTWFASRGAQSYSCLFDWCLMCCVIVLCVFVCLCSGRVCCC